MVITESFFLNTWLLMTSSMFFELLSEYESFSWIYVQKIFVTSLIIFFSSWDFVLKNVLRKCFSEIFIEILAKSSVMKLQACNCVLLVVSQITQISECLYEKKREDYGLVCRMSPLAWMIYIYRLNNKFCPCLNG